MAVSVDWCAFTYVPDAGNWKQELLDFLREHFGVEQWAPKRGWQGYECSALADGVLIAWGGEAQRGSVHVEIPGTACGGCSSWAAVVDWLAARAARLTRCDIAADDHFGAYVSVDWAIQQWRDGGFTSRVGSTTPAARVIDDLGSGEGRTLYVGKRQNGKLARVYEKGRQLGDKLSKWVRFEVEWRAKDRVLELEMLLRPETFIAGAYPCASMFSLIQERVRTFKARAKLTYQKIVATARLHAGRAINAMLYVTGGDIGAVVSSLRRGGLPARLNLREMDDLARGYT